MTNWIEPILLFLALLIATPLLGTYLKGVFTGEQFFLYPLEKALYKWTGIDATVEMNWKGYLKALLICNLVGFLFLFGLLLFQHHLPLNPQKFQNVPWPLAFNTAISFVTNTNWQSYSGESTLGYLVPLLGLTVQNFLSAGTGLASLLTLIRGITNKTSEAVGNFWVDLVRSVVYLLLPLSLIFALVLVSEGSIQNLNPYQEIQTLEGYTQTIPQGPVASQVAIKQLGTNGGGYFNANSSHPFENPTPFTNFLETMALFLIPAALTYTYGSLIGSQKHGWIIFSVMTLLLVVGTALSLYSASIVNPIMDAYPLLEGKETRFGVENSIIWSTATTATANGSVNCMHSSLSPISGGIALFNIMLGELIFGGVGVGLASMIMFIFLTVFLSGLMVGRTPEYLGKKIEKREIQLVMVAVLSPGILTLIGAGLSCAMPHSNFGPPNLGPHDLTAILYAFASCAGNNGSAFAGLDCNTTYYNLVLGVTMLLGRLAIIVPTIALAGQLATKKIAPPNIGTFSVNTLLFFILLTSIILIVGALTFFPALSLGPIIEQLLMLKGRTFS